MELRVKLLQSFIGLAYIFFMVVLFGSMITFEGEPVISITVFIGSFLILLVLNHFLDNYFHKLNTEPEE